MYGTIFSSVSVSVRSSPRMSGAETTHHAPKCARDHSGVPPSMRPTSICGCVRRARPRLTRFHARRGRSVQAPAARHVRVRPARRDGQRAVLVLELDRRLQVGKPGVDPAVDVPRRPEPVEWAPLLGRTAMAARRAHY
eukprot:7362996-Prymnesium_polylepis.2